MNVFKKIHRRILRRYNRFRFLQIYRRFRGFTMIAPDVYVRNLFLAERVSRLEGCIVECGVWKGGMSGGIASILGPGRSYFLFDSFEGLPEAKEIDGEAAKSWQGDKESPTYFDNCTASLDQANQAMLLSGAKSFELRKGWFNETLPDFLPPQPIALLRLDGDWYDSTMQCLESLFQHVTPGGIIVVDDYYAWDGCSRALHDFLSRRSATERISSFEGVCYLEKRA
jgi:hypothetical protein